MNGSARLGSQRRQRRQKTWADNIPYRKTEASRLWVVAHIKLNFNSKLSNARGCSKRSSSFRFRCLYIQRTGLPLPLPLALLRWLCLGHPEHAPGFDVFARLSLMRCANWRIDGSPERRIDSNRRLHLSFAKCQDTKPEPKPLHATLGCCYCYCCCRCRCSCCCRYCCWLLAGVCGSCIIIMSGPNWPAGSVLCFSLAERLGLPSCLPVCPSVCLSVCLSSQKVKLHIFAVFIDVLNFKCET